MSHNVRVEKVLALAINPGVRKPQLAAALLTAGQLANTDPALAFDLSSRLESADEDSFNAQTDVVSKLWPPIVLNTILNTLSEQAYILGLKRKVFHDFATPTAVDVKCDGRHTAGEAFQEHLNSLMGYKQLPTYGSPATMDG